MFCCEHPKNTDTSAVFREQTPFFYEFFRLESYLYSLIFKIYPSKIDDGRPGILNVKIIKDLSPNAFIYPNGSMCVSTGLLSALNSEEELIGVLAHEISHYVLDHSIININNEIQRQNRAEFWASFATGLAAVADGYVASKNSYYSPGAITMGTAIVSYGIASEINKRLGLKYSRTQELEADKCASDLMEFIGVRPSALASALNKIKSYCILTGNYLSLSGEGSHPALDVRIKSIGLEKDYSDINYDMTISFVNSFNAILELNNQHFEKCAELSTRNIKARVATEEDYVLLATATMYMYDTEEKNREAIRCLDNAKKLNVYPSINISKQESIAHIRLGELSLAKSCLQQYLSDIEKEREGLSYVKDSYEWSRLNNYIRKEIKWSARMINKVNNM